MEKAKKMKKSNFIMSCLGNAKIVTHVAVVLRLSAWETSSLYTYIVADATWFTVHKDFVSTMSNRVEIYNCTEYCKFSFCFPLEKLQMSLSICLFVQCLFFLLLTEGKPWNIQKNVRAIAKQLYTACQTLSHVLNRKCGRRRKICLYMTCGSVNCST